MQCLVSLSYAYKLLTSIPLLHFSGLYFKTHNSHRPIDWKATTIKRRRRRRQEFGVPAQYAHAAYQQQYSSAHYDDLHHPSSPSSTGSQGDAHHQSITTPPESPSFYQSHDQHSRKRLPSLSTIFHPSSGPKSASLPRNFSSHDRSHYQQQGTAPYHQHKRTRSQEFEQAQYGRPAACYTPSSQTFVKVGKHHNLPTLSLPSHQARKMSPYHSPLSSSFPSRAHSPCDPQSPLATDCVSRKSSTSALSDDTLPSLVSVLQGLVASVNNCKDTVTKSCPSSPVESHINRNVLPGASTSNYSQVSPIISKKPSIHSLLN